MAKKHKRLTVEELRNYPGLEDLSNEKAEEAIKALENLSILMFELYHKELREKAAGDNTSIAPDAEPKGN